ncbi:teneurin-2-like isoform X4, partial [Tachysurus ichikawai]
SFNILQRSSELSGAHNRKKNLLEENVKTPELCAADCGSHGVCVGGVCRCTDGWSGVRCEQEECKLHCGEHGVCHEGQCVCHQGWTGEHCNIDPITALIPPPQLD